MRRRRMWKQVAIRLADPAWGLMEELAVADDRPVTAMARRLLLERLAQIAVDRQLPADTAGTPVAA
jgi:hypothetical protein